MKNKVLFLLFILLLSSCSTTKILRFTNKTDDVVKTESLKVFLAKNKNPKVVLRVNDVSITVTEGENIDYEVLKNKSDTDLIILWIFNNKPIL